MEAFSKLWKRKKRAFGADTCADHQSEPQKVHPTDLQADMSEADQSGSLPNDLFTRSGDSSTISQELEEQERNEDHPSRHTDRAVHTSLIGIGT